MRYLLDTDHCSYLQRQHPEVVRHFQNLPPEAEVMTSVITQAELLAGIHQAPSERRQQELRALYEQLLHDIADLLPVTSAVAEQFARILADLLKCGMVQTLLPPWRRLQFPGDPVRGGGEERLGRESA